MSSRALLIVEDENSVGIVRQVLGDMGVVVDECRDHSTASPMISAGQYDLVLVDCSDPSQSEQLLKQIRNSRSNNSALVVSVVDVHTSARQTFGAGANFVLYRPVSLDRAKVTLGEAGRLLRRERRRYPRASLQAPTTLSYPAVESVAATLVDLSEEGLAMQCEKPLPSMDKIYFQFALPGQEKSIHLSGATVWQDSSGRAGVRFIDVPRSARRLLKQWLNARIAVEDSAELTLNPNVRPLTASDRRGERRHPCRMGSVVYPLGSSIPHHCTVVDISVGGCYVEMPSPFSTGARVEIAVHTQALKFRSCGIVQVVHPGFGMGIAFVDQNDEQRQQVLQLIKDTFRDRQADADPVLRF